MKTSALFTSGLLALSPALQALEVGPVSLRVEEVAADKMSRFGESQKKSLSVFLTNSSGQDQSLAIKYFYFAKDVKDREVTILSKGEKKTLVKAHDRITVEAPAAAAKSNERHLAGGGRGRVRHEIPAGGEKITGYGVQVFQNGKVTAEYFSEPSFQSIVEPQRQ